MFNNAVQLNPSRARARSFLSDRSQFSYGMVVFCDSDFSRLFFGKLHGSHRLLGGYVSVLLDVKVFVALEDVHMVVRVFDTMR